MSFNSEHSFNRSRNKGIKLLGFRGCASHMAEWEAYQRVMKETHIRTKPRMVAVNSTGGFKLNQKHK